MFNARKCLLASCTQVDVSSNNLGPEGKAAIGNALLRNLDSNLGFMKCDEWQLHEDMTTLNVANNQLRAEDAVLLAGVLAHNKIVTQVAVSSNNLGVEGGKALADCLKSNTSITQVRFVYKCARKQQKAHSSDYFCHLSCLQLSFCTLYTGRSIKLWNGHCWSQGLW